MALIEQPQPTGPLVQGDILSGLTLYRTDVAANPQRLADKGSAVTTGLVLSRNCNACREPFVLVAAVLPFQRQDFVRLTQPEISLDDARRFMAGLRDGWTEPDTFYIGPIPQLGKGRYAANLKLVSTIGLPGDSNERQDWLKQRRLGRLVSAHRRHLHSRLLRAFADEGFGDYDGWPTEDLELIADAGRNEVAKLETEIRNLQLKLNAGQSDGSTRDRALQGYQGQIEKLRALLAEKQQALQPYLAELQRRELG